MQLCRLPRTAQIRFGSLGDQPHNGPGAGTVSPLGGLDRIDTSGGIFTCASPAPPASYVLRLTAATWRVPSPLALESTIPMLRHHLTRVGLFMFALTMLGCSGSKEIIRNQQDEIAQLRVENDVLRDRLAAAGVSVPAGDPAAAPCGQSMCLGETITVLLTDLYFESGSATLTADGVSRLAELAQVIRTTYPARRLRVEGHTDSNPIGPVLKKTFESNWELSTARAAAVVRHFQWTHRMEPERFAVVGYGQYAPVADNNTETGRRQNRRVRIAVLPE